MQHDAKCDKNTTKTRYSRTATQTAMRLSAIHRPQQDGMQDIRPKPLSRQELEDMNVKSTFSPAAHAFLMYMRVRIGSTMYKVPSRAKNLGYREKGCPPVSISNKMPVTTGDAKLQRVAMVKDMPTSRKHGEWSILLCIMTSAFNPSQSG